MPLYNVLPVGHFVCHSTCCYAFFPVYHLIAAALSTVVREGEARATGRQSRLLKLIYGKVARSAALPHRPAPFSRTSLAKSNNGCVCVAGRQWRQPKGSVVLVHGNTGHGVKAKAWHKLKLACSTWVPASWTGGEDRASLLGGGLVQSTVAFSPQKPSQMRPLLLCALLLGLAGAACAQAVSGGTRFANGGGPPDPVGVWWYDNEEGPTVRPAVQRPRLFSACRRCGDAPRYRPRPLPLPQPCPTLGVSFSSSFDADVRPNYRILPLFQSSRARPAGR